MHELLPLPRLPPLPLLSKMPLPGPLPVRSTAAAATTAAAAVPKPVNGLPRAALLTPQEDLWSAAGQKGDYHRRLPYPNP